jgi:tRNA-Thr(GGU) m(6)t(6)A37 methyltransferase TsaA
MLRALGYVRNDVVKPQAHGWERTESVIEFAEQYAPMLEGLDRYSHVIVTFWLDLAADAPRKPTALTLESGRRYGILATRSQLRPNHLGVSVVSLISVDGYRVRVRGLDAIDGTPVLDIKPYLPEYDAHPGAIIPSE